MRILLNESNAYYKNLIESILSGNELHICNTPEEFEERLSPEYDAVIMDLDFMGETAINCAHIIDSVSSPIKVIGLYENTFNDKNRYLFTELLNKKNIIDQLPEIIKRESISVQRFHHKTNSYATGKDSSYCLV